MDKVEYRNQATRDCEEDHLAFFLTNQKRRAIPTNMKVMPKSCRILPVGDTHKKSAEITRASAPKSRAGFLSSRAQYLRSMVTRFPRRTALRQDAEAFASNYYLYVIALDAENLKTEDFGQHFAGSRAATRSMKRA